METQPPPGDSAERPARSRKWLKVLLGVVLVLVVLVVGAWFVFFGAKRSSEPYRMALEKIQQDPEVQDRLGDPIRDGWFPMGRITGEDGRETARFNFSVSGPNGAANVSTVARRIEGVWGLTTLDLMFADGRRLSIRTGSGGALQAAPKWTPPSDVEETPEQPVEQPSIEPPTGTPDIDIQIPGITDDKSGN
jgi:hypothetical protein